MEAPEKGSRLDGEVIFVLGSCVVNAEGVGGVTFDFMEGYEVVS